MTANEREREIDGGKTCNERPAGWTETGDIMVGTPTPTPSGHHAWMI